MCNGLSPPLRQLNFTNLLQLKIFLISQTIEITLVVQLHIIQLHFLKLLTKNKLRFFFSPVLLHLQNTIISLIGVMYFATLAFIWSIL